MSTKEEVLSILQSNTSNFISGQELANMLYVTRASVWKAIKSLQADGYQIDAVTNKGYRLSPTFDPIDTEDISKKINTFGRHIKVIYLDEVDSTNDHVRRLEAESHEDILLIAGCQTKGRGRRGRDFFSPKNTGLYMSLLLHTNSNTNNIPHITATTASAVAKAIDDVIFQSKDTSKIKWVNDIYINKHKVSGILTEAFSYMEDEESNYIIIGIGINIFMPDNGFPKEIKKIAGAIISDTKSSKVTNLENIRGRLTSKIINNIFYYKDNQDECLETYRNKSNLIGNYVQINDYKENKHHKNYSKVIGIDDEYRLVIEDDNGNCQALSSGEVSVVKY
jgi:BirA family biotin operon repressor/biotin-[acetyl-CoA-carboxylase] ligase